MILNKCFANCSNSFDRFFLYYLYIISKEEYNQLFVANSKCEENEACK